MKALIPFCLLAGFLSAQSLTWIDLSGPWRIIEADDPRFAQPDFDDSAWKPVPLPGHQFIRGARSNGGHEYYFWLRRTVSLPAGLETRKLALTLGTLTENYQVYWNGALVASAGNFTVVESRIARPRTFDLPPSASSLVTISIRGWVHAATGPSEWRAAVDPGPYVLTDLGNAPRAAGEAFLDRLRMNTTLNLLSSTVLLLLALIILLISLRQRRLELLLLALFDTGVAYRWLHSWLLTTSSATVWASYILTGPLNRTIFLSFLLAAFRIRARWLEVAAWIFTGVLYLNYDTLRLAHTLVLNGLAAIVLGWAIFSRRKRVPGESMILAASSALFVVAFAVDIAQYYGVPLFTNIGPYRLEFHPIFVAMFSTVMVLDLTRRLLFDSAEKQRLASELEAARVVQQLLLPQSAAATGQYITCAVYEPAQEVGGDFYWTRVEPDGSLLVAVGDVSGKGLKAAMLVSAAVGALRNERSSEPGAVLAALNGSLEGHTGGGFVTCICARFSADGRVTLANAGHLAPFLEGEEVAVESGLPLGVAADVEYAHTELRMAAGELLTLISDGVVEAANARTELFGFDRTREISGKSAAEIADAAKAWGQNDDITVVTVRRVG